MEKKQTAVNFYIDEYRKLEISHNLSEITIGQFAAKIIKLQRQALQMERQQIIDAAADHCYPTEQMALNDAERYYEQHYTQTFKP